MTDTEEPVVPFFRKRSSKNIRKREREQDEDNGDGVDGAGDQQGGSDVVRKKRDDKKGPLTAVSKPRSNKEQDQDDTSAAASTKKDTAGLVDQQVTFAASGTAASIVPNMATRTLDIDGRDDDDDLEGKVFAGDEAEGVYKGLSSYKEYVNKKNDKTNQSNASRIR
jgi:hypothetical protein